MISDNQAVLDIDMASRPVVHKRTISHEVYRHFASGKIQQVLVFTRYVRIEKQLRYTFTKLMEEQVGQD